MVDLHGLSGLEARAAVLCVLSFVQQRSAQGHPLEPRLTFITGAPQHCMHVAAIHCCDDRFCMSWCCARTPQRKIAVVSRAPLQSSSSGYPVVCMSVRSFGPSVTRIYV